MVIGKGMIANSLMNFKEDEELIIFASGVSNSGEMNQSAFQREIDLLEKYQDSKAKLVYFSTCSIFDQSIKESSYILHKKKIENYIADNFKNYLILRLPTVIGNSTNPHIFFNFIKNKLINNQPLEIYKNATRYLFDVEDLQTIIEHLKNKENNILNVCYNNKLSVEEIVLYMHSKLNSSSEIIEYNKGFDFYVDNNEFQELFSKDLNIQKSGFSIIDKYL